MISTIKAFPSPPQRSFLKCGTPGVKKPCSVNTRKSPKRLSRAVVGTTVPSSEAAFPPVSMAFRAFGGRWLPLNFLSCPHAFSPDLDSVHRHFHWLHCLQPPTWGARHTWTLNCPPRVIEQAYPWNKMQAGPGTERTVPALFAPATDNCWHVMLDHCRNPRPPGVVGPFMLLSVLRLACLDMVEPTRPSLSESYQRHGLCSPSRGFHGGDLNAGCQWPLPPASGGLLMKWLQQLKGKSSLAKERSTCHVASVTKISLSYLLFCFCLAIKRQQKEAR